MDYEDAFGDAFADVVNRARYLAEVVELPEVQDEVRRLRAGIEKLEAEEGVWADYRAIDAVNSVLYALLGRRIETLSVGERLDVRYALLDVGVSTVVLEEVL